MKTLALAAGLAAIAAFSAPAHAHAHAQAMEHRVTIEHPLGSIVADYTAKSRVSMRQVGTTGPGGRQHTLHCRWSVSLVVERDARLGPARTAHAMLSREGVAKGSLPGWCHKTAHGEQRILVRHREDLRAAMMTLAEADRSRLLAEADDMRAKPREG